MITLGILGSTGSIGTQALQVAEALADEIKVTALTSNTGVKLPKCEKGGKKLALSLIHI